MKERLHSTREWDEQCPEGVEYETMHLEKGLVTKVTAIWRGKEMRPEARREVRVFRHLVYDGLGYCYLRPTKERLRELDVRWPAADAAGTVAG